MSDVRQRLKDIPGMDIILSYEWIQSWLEKLGRMRVKRIVNKELADIRKKILESEENRFVYDDFKNSCLS